MISINLYQPGRFNYYIQFPTEWNELLSAEVIEISKQQLLHAANQNVARAAILHFIIRYRAKLQKLQLPTGWVSMMDAEQAVINAYPLLDFIYNENTLTNTPENKIKLQYVQVSGIRFQVLGFRYQVSGIRFQHSTFKIHHSTLFYGPGNTFENITCGEFEDTEIYFNEFIEEPEAKPLAGIAAVLWRPKRTPYITYQPKTATYKTYDTGRIINRFLKLQPWRLYAIFTWYTGCRNQLPKIFPTVHEKHSGDTDEPDMMAFTKCIHAASGPKNGSRSTIRMMKLYELMFDMEQEAIKAKELKEYYDQQRNAVH